MFERRQYHGWQGKIKDGRFCEGRGKGQGTQLPLLREKGRCGHGRVIYRQEKNQAHLLRGVIDFDSGCSTAAAGYFSGFC
jgi:hypothetical protein